MSVRILFFSLLTLLSATSFSQGFGIPSKRGGIGFGNLPKLSGFRFNYIDRNVEKIDGINVTVWQTKNEDEQIAINFGKCFFWLGKIGHFESEIIYKP